MDEEKEKEILEQFRQLREQMAAISARLEILDIGQRNIWANQPCPLGGTWGDFERRTFGDKSG